MPDGVLHGGQGRRAFIADLERRGYTCGGSDNPDRSMDVMGKLLKGHGFRLYTPEGSSMFEERSDYAEFPYAHFAARGEDLPAPL